VWDHLRVEPQDDPEARIRALEQPLADRAQATELGTTPYTSGMPPPLPPMPPPAQGPYGQGPYGQGPYTPPGYGAPWSQPPRKASAGIPWVVLGIGAVVFMIVAAGIGFVVVNKSTRQIPDFPGISIPSIPSIPSMPSMPSEPTAAAPGAQLTVAGMQQIRSLECNENTVSISGVSNTVTITGHCTNVTVSGMQNKVTLETSEAINASGFDNVVTYHSGSPDINNAGNNVVQQG
jgi:hypothetical protein